MPTPAEVIHNLDDYGLYLAGIVAGLTALAWLARRTWRATRALYTRARDLGRKIDALDDVAQRELTDGEHGERSTKDYARLAAGQAMSIERLEAADRDHEARLRSLEDWRHEHGPWSEAMARRLDELLELLGVDEGV